MSKEQRVDQEMWWTDVRLLECAPLTNCWIAPWKTLTLPHCHYHCKDVSLYCGGFCWLAGCNRTMLSGVNGPLQHRRKNTQSHSLTDAFFCSFLCLSSLCWFSGFRGDCVPAGCGYFTARGKHATPSHASPSSTPKPKFIRYFSHLVAWTHKHTSGIRRRDD